MAPPPRGPSSAALLRPDPADFSGRELRFRPADPGAARALTADQVRAYNEHGFVAPVDVFDAAEATEIRHRIDDLLHDTMAAGGDAYSINGRQGVVPLLWDLATDDRITSLAADIVGHELVCWGTHLFAKLAGDGCDVPFHQDALYWPFTPTRTTTVWLAIDDVDADNAAVQFVPGSHLAGPIVHETLHDDGTRVLTRRASGMDRWPARYVDQLRAGQASLHSDLTLHGSDRNTSTRRRAGLTLRYAAAEVGVMDGFDAWMQTSIHVRGGDPSRRWADLPRPDPATAPTDRPAGVDAS